jgi:lysophospholipid acyltransferase (LPLAT)-like uncharacterized protein
MKIRRPWLIQSLCMIGFWLVRLLLGTIPCKYWRNGPDLRPCVVKPQQRFIYALWHEYLLVPMVNFSHPTCRLLVSEHADGMIVAEICKHLRMGVVRGSATRGGVKAVRALLRPSRYRTVAITPDGPRGPRRRVKPGIIYLASRLGWPIVAIGVGYKKPWRLRSWDRLAIPRPTLPTAVVTSDPLMVPADLDEAGLEAQRQRLENVLNQLTADAEYAAENGKLPATPIAAPQERPLAA